MDFPHSSPDNYFSGCTFQEPLPREVVIFSRNSSIKLDNEYVHYHSRFNLVVALEGGGQLLLDRELVHIPGGGALIIHPWQTFRFLSDKDKPLRWIFFGFDWSGDARRFRRNKVRLLNSPFQDLAERALYRWVKGDQGPWIVPLLALLLEDYAQLSPHPSGAVPVLRGEHSLIMKIQKIVFDHITVPLSLEEIAELCAYSESRLRHIFKNLTGIALGRYVRLVRFNEAARLLGQTDLSVSQVAERCGFSSVYAFSRGFKDVFGLSPSAYRQRFS